MEHENIVPRFGRLGRLSGESRGGSGNPKERGKQTKIEAHENDRDETEGAPVTLDSSNSLDP